MKETNVKKVTKMMLMDGEMLCKYIEEAAKNGKGKVIKSEERKGVQFSSDEKDYIFYFGNGETEVVITEKTA